MVFSRSKDNIAFSKYLRDRIRELNDYVPITDVDFEIEKKIVNHKICDFTHNAGRHREVLAEAEKQKESLDLVVRFNHPRYFFEPYGSVPWRISTSSMRDLRKRYGNYRANRARDRVNAWVNKKAPDELSSYIMAQLEEYEKFGRKGRL